MSMPLVGRIILLVVGAPPAGSRIIEEIREWSRNACSAVLVSARVNPMPGCRDRAARNAEQGR
jgi:hypothetical protein